MTQLQRIKAKFTLIILSPFVMALIMWMSLPLAVANDQPPSVYVILDHMGDSYCVSNYTSGTFRLRFYNKDILDKKECGRYNSELYYFPDVKDKIQHLSVTTYTVIKIK